MQKDFQKFEGIKVLEDPWALETPLARMQAMLSLDIRLQNLQVSEFSSERVEDGTESFQVVLIWSWWRGIEEAGNSPTVKGPFTIAYMD